MPPEPRPAGEKENKTGRTKGDDNVSLQRPRVTRMQIELFDYEPAARQSMCTRNLGDLQGLVAIVPIGCENGT